jgi:cardiolipin synthase
MKVILNLPNLLTMVRIILIPVFITAVIYKRTDYALYLFALGAVTDKLDGFIARARNEKTALGTFLDPLADKFMLVSAFILFSINGWVPVWLTIVVISRDIIVTTGWILIYLIMHISKVEASIYGKLAIAMEFVLICYILVKIDYGFLPSIEGPLLGATAAFTAFSGLHYIYRGLKITGGR